MANLKNINVTITATDATGAGVNSALRNLGSLGGGFSSVGTIASGVLGGILGANVFSGIARGIGSTVTSIFGLNNSLQSSEAASASMVNAIATSEPTVSGSFGKMSKAADAFERTMREIRERESDGMADYADKIDDIKQKILDAENEVKAAKEDRMAKEKEQLQDLKTNYDKTIRDINENIVNTNYDYAERLYDMNNQKQDKLDNLEEQRANKVASENDKILRYTQDLAEATTQAEADAAQAKIALAQQAIIAINAEYAGEKTKVEERAAHELQVEQDKHERKLKALQQELSDENIQYNTKKSRIEKDAADDIAKAQETADKKVKTLEDQLAKEKTMHERFLRDITEAYADAEDKMDTSMSGGGGGGGRRTIDFQFDFSDAFRDMDPSAINNFLNETQAKYAELGAKSPFSIAQIANFGKATIQYTGGSLENVEKLSIIAQSLAAKNPMQGMLGATTSMVELLGSGNITSLARRFDLPKEAFAGLSAAKDQTEFINMLGSALQGVGVTAGLIKARTDTLGGAFANTVEVFQYAGAVFTKPIYQALTDGLNGLMNKLFPTEESFKNFTTSVRVAGENTFGPMIKSIIDIGLIIKGFVDEHGKSIMDWIMNFAASIIDTFTPAIDLIRNVWLSLMPVFTDTIIPGLKRLFDFIAILWKQIAPELKKTLEAMKEWWQKNSDDIMNVVKFVWGVIEFTIKFALNAITTVIKIALALFRGDWEGAWNAIKDFFGNTWKAIGDLAKNTWDAISGYVRAGINGVIDQINGFISKTVGALNGKSIGPIKINFDVPQIPKLAEGGIVTGPTLALIGENGPEAVVPLNGKRGGINGGSNVNVYVTGNNILDDQTAQTLAEKVGSVFIQQLALQGRYLG